MARRNPERHRDASRERARKPLAVRGSARKGDPRGLRPEPAHWISRRICGFARAQGGQRSRRGGRRASGSPIVQSLLSRRGCDRLGRSRWLEGRRSRSRLSRRGRAAHSEGVAAGSMAASGPVWSATWPRTRPQVTHCRAGRRVVPRSAKPRHHRSSRSSRASRNGSSRSARRPPLLYHNDLGLPSHRHWPADVAVRADGASLARGQSVPIWARNTR